MFYTPESSSCAARPYAVFAGLRCWFIFMTAVLQTWRSAGRQTPHRLVPRQTWVFVCLNPLQYQMYSKALFSNYRLCRAMSSPHSKANVCVFACLFKSSEVPKCMTRRISATVGYVKPHIVHIHIALQKF